MSFQQAHLVAEIYGAQQVSDTGSSVVRNKILGGDPKKLEMCMGWMESLGLTELSLSDAYTNLIGPDKAKWPKPPLPLQFQSSK